MSFGNRMAAIFVCLCFLALSVAAAEFAIPCEIYGERKAILVEVRVSGKAHTFLLDTGAARTVVSPDVLGRVAEFDLKLSRFRSRGPGFSGEATWERVDSLRLGQQVWHDLPVVVMNLKEISQVYGRQIDGLLGQDLLSEFRSVTIDFAEKKVRFSR